jgi:hypothetical protein
MIGFRRMKKAELVALAVLCGAEFRHDATKRQLWAAIDEALHGNEVPERHGERHGAQHG